VGSSEPSSEPSELDARLAEIDRRLRAIQTELAPDGEPRLAAVGPPPDPAPAWPPAPAIRDLLELHERLVDSMRALVEAYDAALARLSAPDAGAAVREFTVAAGPFASTESLRSFERTLAAIPDVREVAIRGYEGEDRAIVDVRFNEPRS
jgi:hypothetical protein